MKKYLLIGLVALGMWGYKIYQDGGNPISEITESLSREAQDFKEGFDKGYDKALGRDKANEQPEGNSSATRHSKRGDKARGKGEDASYTTASYPSEVTERLELPRPSRESGNYFVVHSVGDEVNFSLEYNADKHHSRWVAFTFDEQNCQSRVGRMDTWAWDPKLPKSLSTEYDFRGSGYSRGHLVASEDRVATKEANMQTFYYSNISPQRQEHNGGIWNSLEQKVRSWGRNNKLRRVLYVAKGGTIAEGQIEAERVKNRIVIPKYYWMALLAVDKAGEYHAIAFLTEHRKYERGESNLQKLAMSVDELEAFTGLDFFHNLSDDIEARVEAFAPDSPDSRRYWWGEQR